MIIRTNTNNYDSNNDSNDNSNNHSNYNDNNGNNAGAVVTSIASADYKTLLPFVAAGW